MITKKQRIIITILLALFTLFILKDFWLVGFTNSDDSDCYVRALQGNYTRDASIWAEGQGRFFFYYRTIIAYVPYIIDNYLWTKLIQYIPIILSFVLISSIVRLVFNSYSLAFLSYLLFILFFSIPRAEFVPPTAYPFLFSFDIVCFLLASYFLIKYYKHKKYYYYILSLLCFFIPFYSFEAYLFLFIVYFGIILYKTNPNIIIRQYLKKNSLKETLPPVIIACVFYLIYFKYRLIYGTDYSGNTFSSNINFSNLCLFITNINKSAYPSYIYFHSQEILNNPTGLINNIIFILKKSSFYSILIFSSSSYLFLFLLRNAKHVKIKYIKLIVIILIAIFLSYSINIIPGLSEKYNNLFFDLDAYVTTFIAFYGISFSIFITLIIIKLDKKNQNGLYRNLLNSILFISIFFISLFINFSNKEISADWRESQHRFNAVNNAIKNGMFSEVPNGAVVISPQLFYSKSKLGTNVITNSFSWNKYLKAKTGKKFNVLESLKDIKSKNTPIYEFQFDTKTNNLSLKELNP